MRMYTVYQPLDGYINHNCVRGQFEFHVVFSLNAESLEDAFRLTQNDFNEEYASLGHRSTCVGDIILDVMRGKYYMVNSIGFTEVPSTVVSYIDWGNHTTFVDETMEVHKLIGQDMLDNPENYGLI